MDLGLRGKVAIVTGGARGIGAAIVEGFRREGTNVVIADIELDTAKKLAAKLIKNEGKAIAFKTIFLYVQQRGLTQILTLCYWNFREEKVPFFFRGLQK